MNNVGLTGRLTKDVKLNHTTENQKTYATFTLAVDREVKVQGQQEADFIQIKVWGKQAENCAKFIGKGRLVAITGRIDTRSWEDESGWHNVFEIVARRVEFLDRKQGEPAHFDSDEEIPV